MRNNNIISTLIGIAGLVGIGYGLCAHTKLAKVSKRLVESIDKLADDAEFDIPEDLIQSFSAMIDSKDEATKVKLLTMLSLASDQEE